MPIVREQDRVWEQRSRVSAHSHDSRVSMGTERTDLDHLSSSQTILHILPAVTTITTITQK